MTYEVVRLCSIALLRGRVLKVGHVRAKLRSDGICAFDQAYVFVQEVGLEKALACAEEAMLKKPKGTVKWLK